MLVMDVIAGSSGAAGLEPGKSWAENGVQRLEWRQAKRAALSIYLSSLIDKTKDCYSGGYRLLKVDRAIREVSLPV